MPTVDTMTDVRSHIRRGAGGRRTNVRHYVRRNYYKKVQHQLPQNEEFSEDLDEFVDAHFPKDRGFTDRDREIARDAGAYMRGRVEAQLGRFVVEE